MSRTQSLPKNVGPLDRAVRLALVTGLWSVPPITPFAIVGSGIRGAVGGMLLTTALTQHCTVYQLLGISTMPAPKPLALPAR